MKNILGLILPIFLIILGIQFTRDYFGNSNAISMANYEQLITKGKKTRVVLDRSYKETTIKIAKIPVKMYEVSETKKIIEEIKKNRGLKDFGESDHSKYLPK